MYFFTGDEHHHQKNANSLLNRPFSSPEEMSEEIIDRHNIVVRKKDIVLHLGDFSFLSSYKEVKEKIINRLNGTHIFLKGSHDKWLKGTHAHERWEKSIEGQYVVAEHYAMLTWPRSHYGSWQVYGHSHGRLNLEIMGKQYDVGVDNNNFYPVSFEQLKKIMETKKDNFNLIKK